jgi:glycine cleavage system H lipoate-binding protein
MPLEIAGTILAANGKIQKEAEQIEAQPDGAR